MRDNYIYVYIRPMLNEPRPKVLGGWAVHQTQLDAEGRSSRRQRRMSI